MNSNRREQIDGSGERISKLMLVLLFYEALDGNIGVVKYEDILLQSRCVVD